MAAVEYQPGLSRLASFSPRLRRLARVHAPAARRGVQRCEPRAPAL